MRALEDYDLKKDFVVRALRDAIASGQLPPGERILQEDLADRLQVSATPIREAISELVSDGLLVHEAHKGVCVVELTPAEVREVYMIRGLLESAAAELATPGRDQNAMDELEALHDQMADLVEAEGRWLDIVQLNQAFHERLYREASSPILLDILERLWRRIPWASVGGASFAGRTQGMLEEHAEILQAVKERDGALVADRIREHCRNGSKRVAGYLETRQRETVANSRGIPGSEP